MTRLFEDEDRARPGDPPLPWRGGSVKQSTMAWPYNVDEGRGRWVGTYSGRRFWPLDPRPEDVYLEDVAHALSMLCRFTGHVVRFYSVAEHCINVSRIVDPRHALAGLLHDAAEAYVSDVSAPLKHSPAMAAYRDVERRVQRAVHERFGLPTELPEQVHVVDRALVLVEANLLFRECPEWARYPEKLPGVGIVGLPPSDAEALYLERFKELT